MADGQVNIEATDGQSGGNMEGKESRFGIAASSTWAVFTTAASNGSVNSMHDSYTPLGGAIPMLLMTVSYTHLDVYKRQFILLIKKRCCGETMI